MTLYNQELQKAIDRIKEENSNLVGIQVPDGMMPEAKEIEAAIIKETDAKVLIWLGSNFGACDIPLGLDRLGVDLLISWGHNRFNKQEGW